MTRKHRPNQHITSTLALLATLTFTLSTLAQPTAADKAAADGLFTEAKTLLDAGNFAQACPKFEESQRLDPSTGTALNLGDCYEHLGRTASAYVAFGDAATLARRAGDTARADEADRRADVLQPKLMRLAISVSEPNRLPGLVVLRDGVALPQNQFGTPIPVDPGDHVIEALAPQHMPWKTTVKLGTPGTTEQITVPLLTKIVPPPPPGKPAMRVTGVVLGSVGLASLATSLGFSIAAIQTDKDSKAFCLSEDSNKCYVQGVALRNDAITYSNVATALTSTGGVFVATGVVLYLLGRPGKATEKPKSVWMVAPVAAPRSAGLMLGGVF